MPDTRDLTEALRDAALAVSTAEGPQVFEQLVAALTRILGVDFGLISVYLEPERTHFRTLATVLGGRPGPNVDYAVAGTPCEQAIARTFGFFPSGVAEAFAGSALLAAHRIEGYAATSLHDLDGRPIGALVSMSTRPIEDRARFETVLSIFAARVSAEIGRRRSEASYRAMFENAETALFVHDIESAAIVDVNPKACATYGYSAEELKRLSVDELSSGEPPYTGDQARALIARARAGEVVRGLWHRRNRDGSLHWDEITVKRVEVLGRPHIMVAAREITERKAAEDALRASEEQYRAIFNATTDSLTLRDADFRIVDVNAAYERMSGLRREDVLGADQLTVELLDVPDWKREVHDRAIAGEATRIESEARRRDGSRFRLEVLVLPIAYRGAPHALYVARDITDRERAEAALRASEEQYREIFNATADALVLRDARFRIVDVNAAYEQMSGKRRDEVVGQTELTLTRNARVVDRRALHLEALAGKPVHFETDGTGRDGAPFVLEVRGVPMVYRGEPHVLYMGRDVTESRLAERALRASEEQYRAIFNSTADGLVLRDADYRVVDVNAAYEPMSGLKREEMIGTTDSLLVVEDSRDGQRREVHRRAIAGERMSAELDVVRRDGGRFRMDLRVVPIQYRGAPHVLYIGRDITERKRAEEEQRATWEQYRAIFDATADSLVLRDAGFRVIDVNPAYEQMSGRSRAEVLGASEVTMSDPALAERIRGLHRRALAGELVGWEAPARRKDGRAFTIEVRGVPIRHQGEPHVLYIGRDITERKRAEAERAELEAQLRQAQKMEAIGQLTGGIAHDFNNILQGILGNLVLAEDRQAAAGDAKLGRYLERARGAAQRARDLIQQMLTFSRGRSGEPRPVAPAALVEDATRLLRPALPASIELQVAADAGLPSAALDPVQFEQVILNLCINARDAMQGEGRLEIGARLAAHAGGVCASCRQRVAGRFLEISVRDDGPGIAPDVLDRMFDPFFSTKEVGKGSGMGLAMVHGIVHQHGGHVLVETAPGEGATFRLLLAPGDGPAPVAGAAAPEAAFSRAPLAGRVLVADDEAPIRELLADLLGDWGLEVVACADGAAALDAFAENPLGFDAVISDQTMPRLTGLQLSRHVSRLRPGLPVLLCTGFAEALGAEELAAAGVRALLRKPFEPSALRELLRGALPAGNKAPT